MHRLRELFGVVAYLGFGLGGLLIVVNSDGIYPPFYVVMGYFMTLGAILCVLGVVGDLWAPKLVGLPLLASALITFGALTWRDNGWQYGGPSVLILWAMGAFLTARLAQVRQVARSATRKRRRP